jgi:ferredoxin--NADP+ reductase
MDVSRILAKTVDELRETDIAAHALDLLATSKIKEIHLVGRRGPVQAKFTPPEIREIGALSECDPWVDRDELVLNEASRIELEDKSSQSEQKNYAVLEEFASRALSGKRRVYRIHFLRSPVELQGDGRVERVVLEKNRLEGAPFHQRAVGTGEFETMACDILFRSVGYRGVAMPGLPFEERRGVIPHVGGRVGQNGMAHPGMYVAGWIKRGPSGVIGTNKPDSQETVASLLADLDSLTPCEVRDTAPLIAELTRRGVHAVSYADWGIINAAEIERGHAQNKPREKFTRVQEMLDLLN